MSILLPLGIESTEPTNSFVKKLNAAGLITYLFVNPEKMSIKRDSGLSETRTMGGNVFQAWPNLPDALEFSGIFYGTRSLLDAYILDRGIPSSPDYKKVNLIYKWKRYPGYIKNISLSSEADRPRVISYTFTFVSTEAMPLWRLMIGNATNTTVEESFISAQARDAKEAVSKESLNFVLIGIGAATGHMGWGLVTGALRSAVLYMLGSSIKVSKRRFGSF